MRNSTRYALNGLLDNLAHWFGWLGAYRVTLHPKWGGTYTMGAFTEQQALRMLRDSIYPGVITKRNALISLRGK